MATIGLVKKETQKKQAENRVSKYGIADLCITTGVIVFACFMIYFMLMRAIGLHEVFVLRYLNSLFLLGGILFTLSKYGKDLRDKINYKKGLQIGMLITIISVVPFSLFLFFYLNMDDGFMYFVQNNIEIGAYGSPGVVASLVCFEELCCGSILTFVLMLFFRKKTV